MLFISKKQLFANNANLSMVFICKLFQSRLEIGQFKWSFPDVARHKAIAVFIARLQYFTETCSGKCVVGNPVI